MVGQGAIKKRVPLKLFSAASLRAAKVELCSSSRSAGPGGMRGVMRGRGGLVSNYSTENIHMRAHTHTLVCAWAIDLWDDTGRQSSEL